MFICCLTAFSRWTMDRTGHLRGRITTVLTEGEREKMRERERERERNKNNLKSTGNFCEAKVRILSFVDIHVQ